MHSLILEITDSAIEDLSVIFSYIGEDNKQAAQELISVFYKAFDNILLFPDSGFKSKKYLKHEVRVCVAARHYQIFYYVKDNQLYIQRILTGYQDIFEI